jgi:trans-aconitate 2-methyltransferase
MAWDPAEYLRFGDERTRPSHDLVGRISLENPQQIVDLGCGSGNSTAVLRARWPLAEIVGVDSSAEMIERARAESPGETWLVEDIERWAPGQPVDLVYSNAALQWVPDHGPLVERLFSHVASGGALAFQIPSADFALVRLLIHEVANEGPWASRMKGPINLFTMESPAFYYDRLAPMSTAMDLWETEYSHVLDSPAAVVDWMAGTGLRPFLDVLDPAEAEEFTRRLGEKVLVGYPLRSDGRVLFPFKRTFVIAYR